MENNKLFNMTDDITIINHMQDMGVYTDSISEMLYRMARDHNMGHEDANEFAKSVISCVEIHSMLLERLKNYSNEQMADKVLDQIDALSVTRAERLEIMHRLYVGLTAGSDEAEKINKEGVDYYESVYGQNAGYFDERKLRDALKNALMQNSLPVKSLKKLSRQLAAQDDKNELFVRASAAGYRSFALKCAAAADLHFNHDYSIEDAVAVACSNIELQALADKVYAADISYTACTLAFLLIGVGMVMFYFSLICGGVIAGVTAAEIAAMILGGLNSVFFIAISPALAMLVTDSAVAIYDILTNARGYASNAIKRLAFRLGAAPRIDLDESDLFSDEDDEDADYEDEEQKAIT